MDICDLQPMGGAKAISFDKQVPSHVHARVHGVRYYSGSGDVPRVRGNLPRSRTLPQPRLHQNLPLQPPF